jgi:hypothetical protein
VVRLNADKYSGMRPLLVRHHERFRVFQTDTVRGIKV